MEAQFPNPAKLADLVEELRSEGKLKEALEAVERLLHEDPRHARSRLLLARLLLLRGRLEREGSRESQKGKETQELEALDCWIEKPQKEI